MARPTVARIDLDALEHNVRVLRRLVGARKVFAAVKADAYGHGAQVVCRALGRAGVDGFCVAMTEEAVDLREGGIRLPIMLLTVVPDEDIEALLDHNVTACVSEESFAGQLARAAQARGMVAEAHVKVDTGMHRMGLDWETAAPAIVRMSRWAGLRIAGVFSHFACADADDLSFSREQIRRFRFVLDGLRQAGVRPPCVHMANSNGVMRMPEAHFDAVRPGLMLYGLYSRPELRSAVELRPVLTMRTRVAHLRRLAQGEKVGYGHTFETSRESLVATLPVGYHDGFVRQFSNKGEVLVRGMRAPVIGRVCMDQTIIDVTGVPGVQVGDEVVIYGTQADAAISIEEMAARLDRIPYELTCSVSPRVRREFVSAGAVVVETPFRSVVPTASLRDGLLGAATPPDDTPPGESVRRGAA